jgi:hypothetical protein
MSDFYDGTNSDCGLLGSDGNRQLLRPRRRWKANVKMDLREIRCDSMDWVNLGQDRNQWLALVNMVMNLVVP